MLNFIDLLAVNKTLHHPRPRYRIRPRFWVFIAVIIAIILLLIFWDKIVPESLVTSNYMKGVFMDLK